MIRLHYCRANNFGDAMNPILIERLTGKKCKYAGKSTAQIVGIGSILNGFTRPRFGKRIKDLFTLPTNIWTSGFIKEVDYKENFRKNIHFAAVRGKITKERIEKIVGKKIDMALGDGGLLFNRLLDIAPKKKYKIGFTPHVEDLDNPLFNKLIDEIPHSILINFRDEPLTVLKQIAECEFVLSTSMHGLIAADSFGIPNQWLTVSNKLTGGEYKFKDYYSVFNITPKALTADDVKNLNQNQIEDLANQYKINYTQVEEVQNDLLEALMDIT